jgi:hypothetical protein
MDDSFFEAIDLNKDDNLETRVNEERVQKIHIKGSRMKQEDAQQSTFRHCPVHFLI